MLNYWLKMTVTPQTTSARATMTSSNGNIFRVTGPFVRGIHRWPVNFPHKGQWRGALMFSLICAWANDWVNNRDAGDLRRHRAHYDVTVMQFLKESVDLYMSHMMTSSNGNIFRITGHLCEEFTGPGEFPARRPVTRSFDVYFDLRLNKRLSKQSKRRWFETQSHPLWRDCNDVENKKNHRLGWPFDFAYSPPSE